MDTLSENTEIVNLRIDSLKANRNFFTILFTIESAMLAIMVDHLEPMFAELSTAIFLLSLALVFMLFGLFALTDSLHFYSKHVEYRYMWLKEVHGEAYPKENSEGMAIEALKRALEADEVGYYYLKWGILTILWSFASFIPTLKLLGFYYELGLFLLVGVLLTLTMIGTYKVTHHRKSWREAFRKFFIRKPLFPS